MRKWCTDIKANLRDETGFAEENTSLFKLLVSDLHFEAEVRLRNVL